MRLHAQVWLYNYMARTPLLSLIYFILSIWKQLSITHLRPKTCAIDDGPENRVYVCTLFRQDLGDSDTFVQQFQYRIRSCCITSVLPLIVVSYIWIILQTCIINNLSIPWDSITSVVSQVPSLLIQMLFRLYCNLMSDFVHF